MRLPAPLSPRQMAYFHRSLSSWLNVAEGGKRSGKNVLDGLAFCTRLETHPARLHLVAGVSVAAAKLNAVDCDGMGIKNFFSGRCRDGEYQGRDALYVQTKTGEKIILISGGGKAGDERLIKGNSYGMGYVTEANECTETFVREVFDRTMASPDRAIYHDLNPKGEGHWYYRMLDHHQRMQAKNPQYGLNYGHFTIADNLSLSDEQLRRVLSTYDRKSVWYIRDVLGLRRAPEGLVYDERLVDAALYTDADAPVDLRWRSVRTLAVDYGTTNPLVALDVLDDGEAVWIDREYRWDSRAEHRQKTDVEYGDDLAAMIDTDGGQVIVDPSAASFIAELRSRGLYVRAADNAVMDGIRRVSSMLKLGRIKINRRCGGLLAELRTYRWDDKAAQHGEDRPVKEADHGPDALRYYVNSLPAWRAKSEGW